MKVDAAAAALIMLTEFGQNITIAQQNLGCGIESQVRLVVDAAAPPADALARDVF